MRVQIEATPHLVTLDGVPCRLWEGVTESGIPVKVFVHRIAVEKKHDCSQFECELAEQMPPGLSIDLRKVV